MYSAVGSRSYWKQCFTKLCVFLSAHSHCIPIPIPIPGSTCVPLQQMLRRVCCQLADISPVLANAISTSVTQYDIIHYWLVYLISLIVESVVSEISAVIKDKDKEQKIQNTKELLLVALFYCYYPVLLKDLLCINWSLFPFSIAFFLYWLPCLW